MVCTSGCQILITTWRISMYTMKYSTIMKLTGKNGRKKNRSRYTWKGWWDGSMDKRRLLCKPVTLSSVSWPQIKVDEQSRHHNISLLPYTCVLSCACAMVWMRTHPHITHTHTCTCTHEIVMNKVLKVCRENEIAIKLWINLCMHRKLRVWN